MYRIGRRLGKRSVSFAGVNVGILLLFVEFSNLCPKSGEGTVSGR